MFLHIGNGVSLRKKEIVLIIDIDNEETAMGMNEYIRSMQKKNKVRTVGTELPKSLIITEKDGEQLCHVSPISVQTLKQRNA